MTSVEGSDTRARIVTAAGTLFRRQGYHGTGLQEIAAGSHARVGSIYHFFENKEALAAESIRRSGADFAAMVLALLQSGPPDPVDALGAMFEQAAADLGASDYADACPIATLALEVASTNEPLRAATSDVFEDWLGTLARWCRGIIDDPAAARDLGTIILTGLEGAFILCRAQRTPDALLATGRSLTLLATAMRTRPRATPSPRTTRPA